MKKLVSLIEKKLTLEKLEGAPTDKFYSKNEKNKEGGSCGVAEKVVISL